MQLQVSRGNQFKMPDLRRQFWTDASPLLQSLGWQTWQQLRQAARRAEQWRADGRNRYSGSRRRAPR